MNIAARHAYARAIERVIAHLQKAVQDNAPLPDLAELAAVAHLSPFHFHRIYRALTGETVGRTVARLRLLRALQLLGGTARPVTEVALAVGYETSQALARAFRQALDATPSELRAAPERLQAKQRELAQPALAADAAAPLQVSVQTLAPFELVVLRKRGAFDDLDRGFGQLFAWAMRAGIAERLERLVGIPLGDHRDLPPRDLEFDCAMGFAAAVDPPPPLQRRVLGGGLYAVLRHVGPYHELDAEVDRLIAGWLPGSGHLLRDQPLHFHYLDDPEEVPASILRADICVPVQTAG